MNMSSVRVSTLPLSTKIMPSQYLLEPGMVPACVLIKNVLLQQLPVVMPVLQLVASTTGKGSLYATNEARCGSANVCPAGTNSISDISSCTQNTGYDQWNPNNNFFQWTKGSCSMKVKVRLDGQIAIIHQPEGISRVVKYVSQGLGNINFFVVSWPRDDYVKDELFPTIDNEFGEGTCQLQDDDTCLCDVEVTNGQVFFDDDLPSAYTLSEFRDKVRIGSLPPSQLDGYPNPNDPSATITLDGVAIDIYHKDSGGYTEDTIFRLEDDTDEFVDFGSDYVATSSPLVGYVYLKNFKSEIQIGDPTNDYYTRKLLFCVCVSICPQLNDLSSHVKT